MESKVTTREKIISCFKDGQTIAIGGQTGHWMPERLIDCILESGALLRRRSWVRAPNVPPLN